MGKVTGFMEYPRLDEGYIPPSERIKNYKEFVLHLSDEEAKFKVRVAWIVASHFVTMAAR